MKAACLLTNSIYSLDVSDSGGTGAENGILGLEFAGVGEVVGGDGTTGAGSIRVGSWTSRVGAGSGTCVEVGLRTCAGVGPRTGVDALCCGLSALDVLASDPGAGLPLDSAESWFVLRVFGV